MLTSSMHYINVETQKYFKTLPLEIFPNRIGELNYPVQLHLTSILYIRDLYMVQIFA